MGRATMADGVTPCRDAELLAARAAWARGAAVTPVASLAAMADDMIAATRVSVALNPRAVRRPLVQRTARGLSLDWLADRERADASDRARMLGRLTR